MSCRESVYLGLLSKRCTWFVPVLEKLFLFFNKLFLFWFLFRLFLVKKRYFHKNTRFKLLFTNWEYFTEINILFLFLRFVPACSYLFFSDRNIKSQSQQGFTESCSFVPYFIMKRLILEIYHLIYVMCVTYKEFVSLKQEQRNIS